MKARFLGVAATCTFTATAIVVGGAGNANANTPDPTTVQKDKGHQTAKGWDPEPRAPGLNATQRAEEAKKNREVAKFVAELRTKKINLDEAETSSVFRPSYFVRVPMKQHPQQTEYWCGPAAVYSALESLGIRGISQTSLAKKLKTTRDGTAWYGVHVDGRSTGYPVPDVMNQYRSQFRKGYYYVPKAVGSPTKDAIDTYRRNSAFNFKYGVPVINDAWEAPSSRYRLVGHPEKRTIFHWYTSYGYNSRTGLIHYVDSAASSKVSWGKNGQVPKASMLSATRLTYINSGRGYVW